MHAASVHPEPGSNSLKNFILNLKAFAPRPKSFFRAIYLSFFYFLSFSMCSLTRIAHLVLNSNFFCCSIFNDQCQSCGCPFDNRLVYYTIIFSTCQGVFKSFFDFFAFLCFMHFLLCFDVFFVLFAQRSF